MFQKGHLCIQGKIQYNLSFSFLVIGQSFGVVPWFATADKLLKYKIIFIFNTVNTRKKKNCPIEDEPRLDAKYESLGGVGLRSMLDIKLLEIG